MNKVNSQVGISSTKTKIKKKIKTIIRQRYICITNKNYNVFSVEEKCTLFSEEKN